MPGSPSDEMGWGWGRSFVVVPVWEGFGGRTVRSRQERLVGKRGGVGGRQVGRAGNYRWTGRWVSLGGLSALEKGVAAAGRRAPQKLRVQKPARGQSKGEGEVDG